MGGCFVTASGKVEPYQLVGVKDFKTVHTLWGYIDPAFRSGSADKEYFLASNKFLQFIIQFRIEFSQSLVNPLSKIM